MFRVAGYLCWFLSLAALMVVCPSKPAAGNPLPAPTLSEEGFHSLADVVDYISTDWGRLTRSMTDCATFLDTKTEGEPILYLPAGVTPPANLTEMQKRCNVRIANLPAGMNTLSGEQRVQIKDHGLLYLENPYVVPGGQFNEMYGWDSYFIIRGLLRSGRVSLAKGMVENFFYEIQHYGGVLNANRTYYLGRSQPPFLSSMILAVYKADQAAGASSPKWIERAYPFAVKDYEQWTRRPHLAGDTGLSRYFDEGDGPVPEIRGDPGNYYRRVAHYFLIHEGLDSPHLIRVDAKHPPDSILGPIFQIYACDASAVKPGQDSCESADRLGLAPDAYKGDRSMRESGFDVSFRFGPYGVETHHYAPVCLNSLLYKTEKGLEEMSRLLGRPDDARRWHEKALVRQERITKYLWDEDRGLFFDYNFVKHSRSSYEYATTFYPLWAGLASKEQGRTVARHLALFEQPGGLAMSRHESQAQWDYPYGWAPVHLLAVEGLRHYGFAPDADRITYKFLSMVLRNFRRDHTIREKYDVVSQSTQTHVGVGYSRNVDGFGWTNGVFLELLHESPATMEARLKNE